MDDLDSRVSAHYLAMTAPRSIRERLRIVAQGRPPRPRRLIWLLSGTAAAVLIVVIFVASRPSRSPVGPEEIGTAVAAHFALDQPSEVQSPRIADVAQALTRLDFPLRLPTRVHLPTWQLNGGRYCSIAGGIAAQLRLMDAQGDRHLLYVCRATGAMADISDFSMRCDRIAVAIWREGDLTFAWAHAVKPMP